MLLDLINDVPHLEDRIFDAIKASAAPVALFGAGDVACYVIGYLRSRDIQPVCLCDNNPAKQGTEFLGLPVYSYDALRETFARNGGRYQLVVSVGLQSREAIYAQLAAAREKNPVWYLQGYELCGEKLTYLYFREHLAQFEEAYALLADERSRQVFTAILNAKVSGDFARYAEAAGGVQYFDDGVIELADHETLLDVGAYKGDAIVEFARRTRGQYDAIVAFEPDRRTFAALQNTLKNNGIAKAELHNKGAWHERTVLHFHDGREGSSRVSENAHGALPGASVEVDSIDNVLGGRRATYIVIDIEGAEHNALLGARQTIARWKPKMAVCVYHRREDLFDVPLLLKSFAPTYKFYLRHYTSNQTETVLYAV